MSTKPANAYTTTGDLLFSFDTEKEAFNVARLPTLDRLGQVWHNNVEWIFEPRSSSSRLTESDLDALKTKIGELNKQHE